MSSLAHEGNPKEDEIIISAGDVLSTAQLDLDFLFFGSVDSPNVPSAVDLAFNVSSSCSDVFTWPSDRRYIPLVNNTNLAAQWTDKFPSSTDLTQRLSLTIENSPQCCGVAYVPISIVDMPAIVNVQFGSASSPDLRPQGIFPVHDIEARGTVLSITDKPYAGVACFVEDGSTVHDFTGYVMAANFELGVTKLMKYVHQSLCSEGRVLGIVSALPSAVGDMLDIQVYTDPGAASASDVKWQIIGSVWDSGFNDKATPVDLQTHDSLMDVKYTATCQTPGNITTRTGDRHNRANIGFVAIGNHPEFRTGTFIGGMTDIFLGGQMLVGANDALFGVAAPNNSFSFARGELT